MIRSLVDTQSRPMRVLLVGASGHVGRGVVPLLMSGLDLRLAALDTGEVAGLPVAQLDLRQPEKIAPFLEGVDAVINLAIQNWEVFQKAHGGKPGMEDSDLGYRDGCIDVNIRGAHHLYEAALQAGVKRFIFISSMTAVMGGLEPLEPIPLRGAVAPLNFYACTKLFGEQLGMFYAEQGLPVVCLRLGQPYPLPGHELHLKSERVRKILISFPDAARAIRCALAADSVEYGVYPVVSHSDATLPDTAAVAEIGYEPESFFTAQGERAVDWAVVSGEA